MYVQQFATTSPERHAMNMQPIHYAPHHNGHLPVCGAEPDRATNGGLVICTLEREETTCFRCIDVATETAMTEAQIAQARDAIDAVFEEVRQQAAFDRAKQVTLSLLRHALRESPVWRLGFRYRVRRAIRELSALTR